MRRHHWTPNLEPLEGRSLMSLTGPFNRPGPSYLVVCEGNSLTTGGSGSRPPQSTRGYPGQLQARLGQSWKVLNLGVNGQSIEQMLSKEQRAFARISAISAMLPNSVHQSTISVVWEGTNSLRRKESGEEASRRMAEFVAARHSQQLKVVVLTCLPANNPAQVGPGFEAQRKIYNALIRKNAAGADAVVDVASDRRLMDPNSSYYSHDHFHLSDAGYAVVASLVAQAVRRLAALPPPS